MNEDNMREIWENAKTVAVLSASGIGDSLMATPLIEEIKRLKPKAKLIIISSDNTRQVFDKNPKVDVIHSYNPESKFSFIIMLWKLKSEKIDIFFATQPSNTIKHSLISAFSGAKLKLKHAYDYKGSNERDFSFVYHKLLRDSISRHRVELNLDFLRFFGEKILEKSVYPQFVISNEARLKVDEWLKTTRSNLQEGSFIAIHPGGVRENKRWLPERFAEAGKYLIQAGYNVCLVGGREEIELCNKIEENMNGQNSLINACGKISLEETGCLLKKCKFLLSNDTGIMHLATAVGTPVVAIFGPTDFRHIGPYGEKTIAISKNNNIQDVSVSDVLSKIERGAW